MPSNAITTPDRRTIADQLRESIRTSRMTAYTLGRLAEVDPGVIQRFLNRERDIRLETAARIASALGLRLAPKGRGSRMAVESTSDDTALNPEVETPQPQAAKLSGQAAAEGMLVNVKVAEVVDEPAALSNAVIPEPVAEPALLSKVMVAETVAEPKPATEPAVEPRPTDMVLSPGPATITPFLARLRGQGGGI